MFTFSRQFERNVREYYGSMIPHRIEEAFEEGDYETVRKFLRAEKRPLTWDMLRTHSFVDLKVMSARQDEVKALRVRCEVEVEQRGQVWKPVS